MKMMLKKLNAVKLRAFTLIEMLVVLLIISILLLLFVPNLSKQKDSVKETGNAAVVKVVDSQAELYEMKNNKTASLASLVSEGQITQKQADSYNDYYAKHGGESRSVANYVGESGDSSSGCLSHSKFVRLSHWYFSTG